jgi:2,4-dienoyl-CoA reductase-like NADH-dependent reductase (Old Yellow Enzyme family)
MAEYYAQRASAGLILTEATSVTPMGVGYADTPGIWSQEQVQGWKKITKAVHDKGGKIFMQLWHVGRISDPMFLNGELPVAPSAIQPKGHVSLVRPERPYVTPRALETNEIPGIVEAYKKGAENAFDFLGKFVAGQEGVLIPMVRQVLTMSYLFNTFLTNEYISRYNNIQAINYVKTMAEDLKTVFIRIIKKNNG